MFKYYEINANGNNIRCKLYTNGDRTAERAVIYCTGFAGHKDNGAAAGFAEMVLPKKDIVEIVFNWPAHGDDVKKKLALDDCGTYLEQVVRDAKERFHVRELYVYATSFGGYVVLKYISEHENPFQKIVLRCPAVCMYDVLTRGIMKDDEYERILKGKDVQVGFDRKIVVTRSLLDELQTNDIRRRDYLEAADDILILHGTKDEIVPFEEGRAFAEQNLIEFIPVQNADHRFQNPAHMSFANKAAMAFFGL